MSERGHCRSVSDVLGHTSYLPRSHRIDIDELLTRATSVDRPVRLSKAEVTSLIKETSYLRHHVDLLEAQLATSRSLCRTLTDTTSEWQERHALLLEILRDWLRVTTGDEAHDELDACLRLHDSADIADPRTP